MKRMVWILSLIACALFLNTGLFAEDDPVLQKAREKLERSERENAAEKSESTDREERSAPEKTSDEAVEERDRSEDDDEENEVTIPVYFSPLPGNFFGMKVNASIAGGLIMSTVNSISGAQFAPVMCIANKSVNGVQFSGVGNISGGSVNGGQFSGVFNISKDSVNGFQGAGVFNINDGSLNGAQGAGVFNITRGEVRFAQFASVFNIADGNVHGIQGAGVFNLAGDVNGAQTAGVVNVAKEVRGVQAAGIFNIAGDVNGAQIAGVVNIAKEVHGVQIGLVNISEEMYGLPIGLVNIVKNGIFDFSVWYDQSDFVYVGMQKGTSNLYVLLYGGERAGDWFKNVDSYTFGLGLGGRGRLGPLYVDIDASAKHMLRGVEPGRKILYSFNYHYGPVFPSFRVAAGLSLFNRVGVHCGLTLDCHVPEWSEKDPVFHSGESIDIGNGRFTLYPKWFIGVKF